jgi:hypothetical protein
MRFELGSAKLAGPPWNRHHSLRQQLCRWLLLSLDRLQGDELVIAQELIANMLGVRREGVTECALKLQQAGIIRYARGHITVLDRAALEKCTCECYAVVKKEYDRLLPNTEAHRITGRSSLEYYRKQKGSYESQLGNGIEGDRSRSLTPLGANSHHSTPTPSMFFRDTYAVISAVLCDPDGMSMLTFTRAYSFRFPSAFTSAPLKLRFFM